MAKPRAAAAQDELLGAVDRVRQEQVRVSVRRFQGKRVLDLRIWVQDDLGKWIPTGRGVALGPEDWKELRTILGKLHKEGRSEAATSDRPRD
jgi:hypothetical protein